MLREREGLGVPTGLVLSLSLPLGPGLSLLGPGLLQRPGLGLSSLPLGLGLCVQSLDRWWWLCGRRLPLRLLRPVWLVCGVSGLCVRLLGLDRSW